MFGFDKLKPKLSPTRRAFFTRGLQILAACSSSWPWRALFAMTRPKVNRTIWAWGYNSYGGLGLGDTVVRSSPVQVGSLSNWTQILGGGYHTLALRSDGTIWTWGFNNAGQLGLGDTVNRSSPVQVGSLNLWTKISAGFEHNVALQSDGSLWAWGVNDQGELGLGDTVSRSSPVQVGSLVGWAQIAANQSQSTLAIKSNGTLWAWGYNNKGQLGLGATTSRSSPVQVGALTTWVQVTTNGVGVGGGFTLALQSAGTLWAWGYNGDGELGRGNTVSLSSPMQVGALTKWTNIFAGYGFGLGMQDGSLFAWGDNTYGELGLGDQTNRSSPVQVGSLTNWAQVSGGNCHVIALQNDGTLWAWGDNFNGKLGLGDATHRSSPVCVSTDTWTAVGSGDETGLALK